MKSHEIPAHTSTENDTAVMESIARSKIIKRAAIAIAALGLVAGAAEGIKSVAEAAGHQPTAIEYAHDASGYRADYNHTNLNNPNTLLRLVQSHPEAYPKVFVHLPGEATGKETEVPIATIRDLGGDVDLTDAGLAVRQSLMNNDTIRANYPTPELQADYSGFGLKDGRAAAEAAHLYTSSGGESHADNIPQQSGNASGEYIVNADGSVTHTVRSASGGYEKIVEQAPSSLEK